VIDPEGARCLLPAKETTMKPSTLRSSALAALLAYAAPLAAIPLPAVGTATIKEYPLVKGAEPLGITLGPDGNIWFVESNAGKVGRITPGGVITEFPIDAAGFAQQIVSGSQGDVYFTEPGAGKVGLIHALGDLTVHESASGGGWGLAIAFGQLYLGNGGPDLSFLGLPLFSGGGTVFAQNDGKTHNFYYMSSDIYGDLWMTDTGSNAIVQEACVGCIYATYALANPGSGPKGVAAGRDDNIWFTEYDGDRIGRLNRKLGGTVTEFALATGSRPQMIAAAPDGSLWFAESGTNKIARITVNGAITEYNVPTADSHPYGVAIAADGSVWFTEEYGAKIGHLMVHPPGDANGDGLVNVSDVFYVINFLFAGGPEPK
jgi:streptogramin lyase